MSVVQDLLSLCYWHIAETIFFWMSGAVICVVDSMVRQQSVQIQKETMNSFFPS